MGKDITTESMKSLYFNGMSKKEKERREKMSADERRAEEVADKQLPLFGFRDNLPRVPLKKMVIKMNEELDSLSKLTPEERRIQHVKEKLLHGDQPDLLTFHFKSNPIFDHPKNHKRDDIFIPTLDEITKPSENENNLSLSFKRPGRSLQRRDS